MTPRRQRFAAALAAVVLAGPLAGWRFIDPPRKWDEANDMPIVYFVGEEDPTGIPLLEARDLLLESHLHWRDVECSPLDFEEGGLIPNEPSFSRDDRTQLTFQGGLGSGVLAATVTHANFGDVLPYNGTNFAHTVAYNIIYGQGIGWGTPEVIASPSCFGVHSFVGVSTHEIGHGLGLGHSCENGEPCPDPLLRSATMYWAGAQCDDAQDVPNEDDSAGINGAYGVAVDFDVVEAAGGPTIGPAPLTVVVSVPAEYQTDRFDSFEWNFGDGSDHVTLLAGAPELDGLEHTYGTEGQYTITLTAFGDDPSCGGEFSTAQRRVGAVLACGPPVPSAEYANQGGFVVQMVNTSPLGAFGCTTGYRWVLDGDADSALSTYEPRYEFDGPGSHTVTLTASGPAGEATAEIEVEVRRASDLGCNASLAAGAKAGPRAGAGALLGLLLAVFGLRPRRRR